MSVLSKLPDGNGMVESWWKIMQTECPLDWPSIQKVCQFLH